MQKVLRKIAQYSTEGIFETSVPQVACDASLTDGRTTDKAIPMERFASLAP